MIHRGVILASVTVAALLGSGAVDAGARLDVPQDATPAPATVADLLRQTPARPATPDTVPAPVESAPVSTPAPAVPVAVTPPPAVVVARAEEKAPPVVEPAPEIADVSETTAKDDEPPVPARRQRRPVAVIQIGRAHV